MIELQRILVATDFGAASGAALKHAIRLARETGAHLHLLHVIEDPDDTAASAFAYEQLRRLLAPEEARALRPRCSVRPGPPADAIVDYARDREVDLIVMGTHGRDGIVRAVMGSVAEKVVRRARCPVLTVHQPDVPLTPIGVPVVVGIAVPKDLRLELT